MRHFAHIFVLVALLTASTGFAQRDRDKVEALRVEFISKRLGLNVSESEKFWPVYNEYQDKLRELRRTLRQAYHGKGSDLSESEAEALNRLELQTRQSEAELYKAYSEKIRTIIGIRRLALLNIAEEDFRRELIKTIRDK